MLGGEGGGSCLEMYFFGNQTMVADAVLNIIVL